MRSFSNYSCLLFLLGCSEAPVGEKDRPGRADHRSGTRADSAAPGDSAIGGSGTDDSAPPPDSDPPDEPGPDTDADNDHISDEHEGRYLPGGPTDTDGDGRPDYLDLDSDDDGIPDSTEGDPADPSGFPPDTDGDGIPDFRDLDTDADSIPDSLETTSDLDGDGIPDWRDARSDAPTPTLTLVAITTPFNSPVGIDFHEPTETVIMSVNYSGGSPYNFERVEEDGTHVQFSSYANLTNEVKIATARSGNPAGFPAGEFFVGNGTDGQIARISADGTSITNPWVDLPGGDNGLMRGSLYVDRTGVFGGDLIAVTTLGEIWRVDASGNPTLIADLPDVHLEGMVTVPDAPARYGPLAGMIIAGAEQEGRLYAIAADGSTTYYEFGVNVEDIDIIMPYENFFGVNYGGSTLLGVPGPQFAPIVGDIVLAQESASASSLWRLFWTGTELVAEQFPLSADSATVQQWEHVTFAGAGIVEVPLDPH